NGNVVWSTPELKGCAEIGAGSLKTGIRRHTQDMKAKQILLIGCGTLLFLTIATVIIVALLVNHDSKDVEHVADTVNGPADVVVGQTFDLEVVVKNQRSKKV